jgi:tetratricopeptide (TPR) repeat protein
MTVRKRPCFGLLGSAYNVSRRRLAPLRSWLIAHLHSIAEQSFDEKQLVRAEVAYQLILRLNRSDPAAIAGLIELYHQDGRPNSAIDLELTYISGGPDDFLRYLDLAALYLHSGHLDKAEECLRAAAQREPDSHLLKFMRGQLYRSANKLEEASECFRQCLSAAPGLHVAMLSLSNNLNDLNQRHEAVALLESVVRVDPTNLSAYANLASLRYYSDPNHPHVTLLRQRLADNPRVRRRDAITAHFTLGDIFDSVELYETAFNHYRTGNELVLSAWNADVFSQKVARQIQLFTRETIMSKCGLRQGNLGSGLAFVVGMPRSGSTLVEQILASHPDVVAGGERSDFPEFVDRLPQQIGGNRDYPECVHDLDGPTLSRLRDHYVERLKLSTQNKLFVDKTLANYLELGLISIVFPEAKIIHCSRDPLDTCLSCYFQNFENVPYSTKLSNLGRTYRQYQLIMAYWRDICQRRFYEASYEIMANHFEESVRALLDYCGLSWNAKCLEFYKTSRPVKTASMYQVKMPLYRTSIGRWRHYEAFLSELRVNLS